MLKITNMLVNIICIKANHTQEWQTLYYYYVCVCHNHKVPGE